MNADKKSKYKITFFYETSISCRVRRAGGSLRWWFLRLGLLWALEAGMEKQ
jgi:hypothetical protein